MGRKKMPRSIRKFIRQEKARIRREVLDTKKQGELINQLYQRFLKKDESKRNLQSSDKQRN
ncbi:hypothetical protein AMJ48_02200 [Parcubacteria bacterium DG_74_1]|nr:MAG: hypothetical protein AMJ48_02200 [Parcubacteria bacterium DG_74_1]